MNTYTMMRCRIVTTAFFLLMLFPGLLHAEAGHFLFVYGKVSVTASNGAVRQAAKGMPVQEGDTITSGLSGAAQLRMKDGAFLALRPNTILRLDAYAYKDKGRKTQSTISLLKGTFRAISGKIGKNHPREDLVKTPVATIGIRGTDHEPAYIPLGSASNAPPGAYDKVNEGETFMQTSAGRIDLGPNEVGHAASMDQPPVTLPAMPAFYQTPEKAAVNNKKGDEDNGEKNSSEESGKSSSKKNGNQGDKDKGGKKRGDKGHGGSGQGSNDQEAVTGSGSTGEVSTSSGTSDTDSNTTNTTPPVVQTVDATSSTGTSVNLTEQTSTDSSGTTTTLGETTTTITTAALKPKDAASVSYRADNQGTIVNNSFLIDGVFGETFTTNTAGALTAWAFQTGVGSATGDIKTGTVNGINGTPGVTDANSFFTTGIKFGSYAATSVALGLVNGTTNTDTLSPQYFNWITGPGVTTPYLPIAYRGTSTFTFDGGILRTERGMTPSAFSSSITVNFSTLSLGLSLNATVPTGAWVASASNVPLDGNSFSVWNSSQPAALSVTYTPTNGTGLSGFGNISGLFTGQLTGLLTNVNLGYSTTNSLTGVGAFVNSTGAVSTAINHQIVGFAATDPRANFSNSLFTPTLTNGFYNVPGTDITKNAAGGLTKFLTSLPSYFSTTINTVTSDNVSNIATYLSTTGTVTDVGTDSVSGISWGRWASSGISNATLSGSGTGFNPPGLHYITGPVTSQPVQLPVSATYNYTLAGNTTPTNQAGNTGTLNSASLTANFTSMTVDLGINATVGATTLAATATGMPIQSDASFDGSAGTSLSITCTGTCNTGSGSVNTGNIGGAFTGSTGNGAGVAYSLRNAAGTTSTGTVISGVAAFHR